MQYIIGILVVTLGIGYTVHNKNKPANYKAVHHDEIRSNDKPNPDEYPLKPDTCQISPKK